MSACSASAAAVARLRPSRREGVKALVRAFADEAPTDHGTASARASGSGETLAEKERIALQIAAKTARDAVVRPDEVAERFEALAFKHEVSLQSEVADAMRTVMQALQREVHDDEATYRSELDLHALRQAEAKSHFREDADRRLPVPPPPQEPLVRPSQISELLNMLLDLSRQPTIHTLAHASLLANKTRPTPADAAYLTAEQKQAAEREVWLQILKEEPLEGEGWEDGSDGGHSSLDRSDRWSSDDDEPRTPASTLSKRSRQVDGGVRANLDGALDEWRIIQPSDSSTWEGRLYAQVEGLKKVQEQVAAVQDESTALGLVTAIRQLLALMSCDALPQGAQPAVQHTSDGATRHALQQARDASKRVQSISDRAAALSQHPSRLLQAFAEACEAVVASWRGWLAREDARVALLNQQAGATPVTLAAVMGRASARARSLQVVDEILASEPTRPSGVRIINKVQALMAEHSEYPLEAEDATMEDLSTCFAAIAAPICDDLRQWTARGVSFTMSDGAQDGPTESELFMRQSGGQQGTGSWTQMYRLNVDENGEELIPAFAAPFIDDILQAGMSVGLLRAFTNADVRVLGHADAMLTFPSDAEQARTGHAALEVIARAQASLRALVPEAKLAQKRAHNCLVLPSWEGGCGLYQHLAALQDLFLLRRGGDTHAWAEEIFLKIDTGAVVDTQMLNAALRDAGRGEEWLNLSLASFKCQGALPRQPFSLDWVSAIQPRYTAPWPLPYIITPASLQVYASVFTMLLKLKRTRHLLVRAGRNKPGTLAERTYQVGKPTPKQFFPLRRRLLWLVNTLTEYYNRDAIGLFIQDLDEGLMASGNVSSLADVHAKATERLQHHALLSAGTTRLGTMVGELLTLCVQAAQCHFAYQSGGNAVLKVHSRSALRRRRRRGSDDDPDDDDADRSAMPDEDLASLSLASASVSALPFGKLSVRVQHGGPAPRSHEHVAEELPEADFEEQIATLSHHLHAQVNRIRLELGGAIAAAALGGNVHTVLQTLGAQLDGWN